MRAAHQLLTIAERLCGPDARSRVFEPLVADWQHEWHAARGIRRVVTCIAGVLAFVSALLRMVDLSHLSQQRAAGTAAVVTVVFAVAAAVVQLQPAQFVWRHWDWNSPHVWWVTYDRGRVLRVIPTALSYGILLAILPAAIVLGAGVRTPTRRLAAACALAAAIILALDGWIGPAIAHWREQEFHARAGHRAHLHVSPVIHASTGTLVRLAVTADAATAADARSVLGVTAARLATLAALGLLGGAIGRARAVANAPIGLRPLVAWWAFGYSAIGLLGYWSIYLRHALGIRAPLRTWLPALALLAVAMAARVLPARPAGLSRRA